MISVADLHTLCNGLQFTATDLQQLVKELGCDKDEAMSRKELLEFAKATPHVEVLGGIVGLLESTGVLVKIAEHLMERVARKCVQGKEADALSFLKEMDGADLVNAWLDAQHDIIDDFVAQVAVLRATKSMETTAADFNAKYANDDSTFEGVYADQRNFREGLEGSLGLPGTDVYVGMQMEFCESSDSNTPFKTSNYDELCTTPAQEYSFVVGDKPTDFAGAGLRHWSPLPIFLFAVSAKEHGVSRLSNNASINAEPASSSSAAASDDDDDDQQLHLHLNRHHDGPQDRFAAPLDDLPPEISDGVRTVLLRRVKEAGLTPHFVAAAAQDEASESVRRLQRLAALDGGELDAIREAVARELHPDQSEVMEATGQPSYAAARARLEHSGVLRAGEADALVECMRKQLAGAGLWEEELIALRLYTGPAFVKLNDALRDLDCAGREGNRYVNSIYAAVSGMVKLAEVSPVPPGREVCRGQRGLRLPECFWRENAQGVKGGTEMAFLSTTTDRHVAAGYAADGALPTVISLQVGAIDKGAALGFLSQFPLEDEILMPPRSFVEVVGAPSLQASPAGGGPVLAVPAKLNCNLQCPTLDMLEGRRKAMLVSTLRHVCKEIARDTRETQTAAGLEARRREDRSWTQTDATGRTYGERFLASIEQEALATLAVAQGLPAGWYQDDVRFRRGMQQALGVQRRAGVKLELWRTDRTRMAKYLDSDTGWDCDRVMSARLWREVQESDGAEGEEGQALVRRLCQHLELTEGDVDQVVDTFTQETVLMQRAAEGDERVVWLLLRAKANVEAVRRDDATALMLAADSGHTGVVKILVQQGGARVNARGGRKVDESGRSAPMLWPALMFAVEEQHMPTVEALVQECGADVRVAAASGYTSVHIAAYLGHLAMVRFLVDHGGDPCAVNNDAYTPLMAAAQNGHLAVVCLLAEIPGVEVDARTTRGTTALMLAAEGGHLDVVQYLCQCRDANMALTDNDGRTVLRLADERVAGWMREHSIAVAAGSETA